MEILINMKKLLLLCGFAFMAVLMAYSQNLQLSDSAGSIANNASIVKFGLPSDEEVLSFIFVKNTSSDSIAVKVKRVEISTLSGTTVFVSPDSIVIHAGRTDSTNFSGHYSPNGVSGNSTIRYVFFNSKMPTDTVCVNVTFAAFPQGIDLTPNVALFNAYPNPANNSVSFSCSVPQNSHAKLMLRNVLGSVVREFDIDGNAGKLIINTSDLADGVYFYTFLVNGNSAVTKKLVIRH
jgi:hypothetical protein